LLRAVSADELVGQPPLLVGDAHTTVDMTGRGAPPPDGVVRHTHLYWGGQRAPGRLAGVVAITDIDFPIQAER
jgi:hypothetical protein